jgi:hypothetical protein
LGLWLAPQTTYFNLLQVLAFGVLHCIREEFIDMATSNGKKMDTVPDYQNIFHWAETQKDGSIPSFATRVNDPYQVHTF